MVCSESELRQVELGQLAWGRSPREITFAKKRIISSYKAALLLGRSEF